MADNIFRDKNFKKDTMGLHIDALMEMSKDRRNKFERRWYENNFFDDGYHFRYISRTTGRIVDLSNSDVGNVPIRAIPKASRQIRGIANLLLGPTYVPVVYPEKVQSANYDLNTPTGQEIFEASKQDAKRASKRSGHWIMEEWKKQDMQRKLTEMLLVASKTSVSYIQIWPDAVEEKINTRVYDGFDIYLLGDVTDLQDSPFLIKSTPKTISWIKANELFDQEKVEMLSPDNKYASSELKDSYKRARYGSSSKTTDDDTVTVLLKEAFVKEYLSKDNFPEIASRFPKATEGKKVGDVIMRHTFAAGGVALRDEYLAIEDYPFVEFTFEPGPLYQTPLIERFIPMNKSLDVAVSRVERYINTMATGHWLKRRGEDFKITNIPGGQVLEYETTPPVQGSIAPLPNTVQNYITQLEAFIEEQGASTSALGQLPPGVKSGVAIESLKETEFLNLKIAADQVKNTVKKIAETFFKLAANEFTTIQTVERLEKGEPDYFDIIGEVGYEIRQAIDEDVPEGTVILRKDIKVDIEVESGSGFTRQGQREVAQQFANYILQLAQAGAVSPDVVRVTTEKMVELFGFGNTQEIAEALEQPTIAELQQPPMQNLANQAIAQQTSEQGAINAIA